jgi:hypothetical protein
VVIQPGQVAEAEIIQKELSAGCKAALVSKLLSMEGWTHGKMDGQSVCSMVSLPINISLK